MHQSHSITVILVGVLLVSVFYLLAITTQKAGVAVSSIALKMSMVIPICLGFIIYDDLFNIQKATGISFSVIAVILVSINKGNFKISKTAAILPFILFLGGGLVDTSLKFIQHNHLNDNNINLSLMSIFIVAGVSGSVIIIMNYYLKKIKLQLFSILGGIVLGILNYYSLYSLLKALALPGAESSTIFAIVNVAIVITSTILSILIFNEQLGKLKKAGLICAIVAILLLTLY
jgi:drug/metabolite transporter (DMT)-like permease